MSNRDPLILQVRSWCEKNGLLPRGGTLLAAVSGGTDSMCLLHVLRELAPEYGFALAAAHYHHGLRGAEADRDADFTAEHCRQAGIPCFVGHGDAAAAAREGGLGLEEAGRQLRYDFLYRTAEALGGAVIATAHNADDNAETVLLHLVRGTGLQGLTGIPPRRGNVIRPLLSCTRAEIAAWNARNGIPHVEDSTNDDLTYSRNRLRHEVMPVLKELNPGFPQGVIRTTEALRRDNALLARQSETVLSYAERTEEGLSVPVSALTGLPEALQPRAVQLLYRQLRPDEILSASHREAVLALAAGTSPSGFCALPAGITARRAYDRLIFDEQPPGETVPAQAVLPLPGSVCFFGRVIQAQPIRYDGRPQRRYDFCLRTDGTELIVRTRETGDRLHPVGRPEKTLKKWMIDEKIPRVQRDRIPVLAAREGKLLAVPGIGADRCAHPARGEDAWHITVRPQTDGKESES